MVQGLVASADSITAHLDITSAAILGSHTVVLVGLDGGTTFTNAFFTVRSSGGVSASGSSASFLRQGDVNVLFRVFGSNMSTVTGIEFVKPDGSPETKITTANFQASASSVSANLTIGANVPIGPRRAVLDFAGGVKAVFGNPVYIQTQSGLYVTFASGSSGFGTIIPGSAGQQFPIYVYGNNLGGITGLKCQLNGVDDNSITVSGFQPGAGFLFGTVTIAGNAPLGTRTIVLMQAETEIPTSLLLTIIPTAPALTSISPASGNQGQSVNVTLTGANLALGTTTVTVSGTGVTVQSVSVLSSTSMTATFVIANDATTGLRSVTVSTSAGTSGTRTFTVNTPAGSGGPPTLTSIAPNSAAQGQQVNVTLSGTNFVSGGTVITVAGTGVTAQSIGFAASTSVTAAFLIEADAATGARAVTVSTAAGTSGSVPFNVFGSTETGTSGYSVSTVAGLTTIAEGESATAQPLPSIRDVARDAAGNLYIAVFNRHKVYKITPNGTLTTFAGSGIPGPAGDGGLATAAQLNGPRSVDVDNTGNVYIADSSNNRIRMVRTDGTITTVAGNQSALFSGDGGSALAASLFSPSGVLVDPSGNIFILDRANQRIRKIDPFGRITTVAGTGTAGFSGDGGPATAAELSLDTSSNRMALDASSNLYIPDTLNNRIRKVSADGIISTVAGNGTSGFSGDNGPSTAAQLASPRSVAFDSLTGILYIADTANNRIRRVTANGTISTFAGTGSFGFNGDGLAATSSFLANPNGLIFDAAGNLYVADEFNDRVRRIAAETVTTLAGLGPGFSGDNGPLPNARFYAPGGVVADPAGNVFIADTRNARIRKLTPTGAITTVAGNGSTSTNGSGGPALTTAIGIVNDVAFDPSTGAVFFASTDNRVRKLGTDGSITVVAGSGTSGLIDGPATQAQIANPQGVAVASNGDVHVTDSNNRIRKVSNGAVTTIAGNGSTQGDGGPAIDAQLSGPGKIAIESSTGNIYFTERTTGRLRKIDTSSGTITSVLTSGAGWGLGFDFSGDLYSSGYSLISKTPPGGTTTKIASPTTDTASVQGFTGDSGAAKLVAIAAAGLAVTPAGEVYFADDQDQLIRKLTPVPEGSAALSVTSLGFFIRSSTQTTRNLPIALDGIGPFTWTASANSANWLTISPLNGTGSGSTTLTVNPTGLAPGNYNGSLTISSPQAVNGPVIVPVTLVVPPQPPALTLVNPSNGNAGTTVNVELTGTNFVNGATAVVVSGTGVTTTSVNVANATTLNASLAIASDTAPGNRGIYVVTSGGSSATQTFTVNTNATPSISSIEPADVRQGDFNVNFKVNGNNLAGGGVQFRLNNQVSQAFTLTNINNSSNTQLVATLAVGTGTPLGNYGVTVSTAAGTSNSATLPVLAFPVVMSVSTSGTSPGVQFLEVVRGTFVTLTATGMGFKNTDTMQILPSFGGSALSGVGTATFDPGLTVTTATWNVPNDAPLGQYRVYVRSTNGTGSSQAILQVKSAAGALITLGVDSGNNQTGQINQPLPQPMAAIATENGIPVGGMTVTFTPTSGGGVVRFNLAGTNQSSASVATGADGKATAVGVLGPNPGANTFRAALSNAPNVFVDFRATANE